MVLPRPRGHREYLGELPHNGRHLGVLLPIILVEKQPMTKQEQVLHDMLNDIRLWAYRGKQADAGANERRKILRHIEKLAKSALVVSPASQRGKVKV